MQFPLYQDPEYIAKQLDQFVQTTPVDEIMFFFYGEELNNGHETLEEISHWINHSRPYRSLLAKRGINISLNPWHTLLHSDSGRRLKPEQNWQPLVDPFGKEAQAMVCFMDPRWQEYYLSALKLYAQEGFRVIWIDDDIRYHNHHPLDWGGCFCPLHIKAFNDRAGTHTIREEIVQACLQPGEVHPWRSLWMDTWQETQLQFLEKCRHIIEAGGARMGLMSSLIEAHSAEGRRWKDWWKTFGGEKPPIHRPHFWGYSDAPGSHLLFGIAALDQNRRIEPEGTECGPEIECFPYGIWNKSYRQIFAQMSLAHILGASNVNISLFDFMGNDLHDHPDRAAFLQKVRPTMDWLSNQFAPSMHQVGVGIPWSEDLSRKIQLKDHATWHDLQVSSRGWAYWLGSAGIAFSMAEDSLVNSISGSDVWAFSDEQILNLLGKGLLLDGPAADILNKRGFGAMLGITRAQIVSQNEKLYSIEDCYDGDFSARTGAQITLNNKAHTKKLLFTELDSQAHPISWIRSPKHDLLGPGAFIYINKLGGRVAIVPWDAGVSETPLMDAYRAIQLKKLIQWLAEDRAFGMVAGGAWLIPQFLKDTHSWKGVIWNAGPDDKEYIQIQRPEGMDEIQEIVHCMPNGERIVLSQRGDTLRLQTPLRQWEYLVLSV
jgi:hypothetical protein